MEEDTAKDAFIAAQSARNEQEAEIRSLVNKRMAVIRVPAESVAARIQLEQMLEVLDSEERSKKAALAVLETEESKAQAEWNARRQAVKIIEKLMEKAEEEWKLSEERREQAELDEWTVTRRAA